MLCGRSKRVVAMKKVTLFLFLVLLMPWTLRTQGIAYTLNPPVPNGTLYVCTYPAPPMPPFPCATLASLSKRASLRKLLLTE